jgi:hypothetical protein
MVYPDDNRLTPMSPVVSLAHRNFYYLAPSPKYSAMSSCRLQVIHRLWIVDIGHRNRHSPSLSTCPWQAPSRCAKDSVNGRHVVLPGYISALTTNSNFPLCPLDGFEAARMPSVFVRLRPWRRISGIVRFARIYVEVRKYDDLTRKWTDADACSCPSGSSRFLPSGTMVQIFSNSILSTVGHITTILTVN